jgi:hypothetical protein
MSTPPTVVATPRQPEVTLDRALDRQRLLDEVGDAVAFAAQQLLDVGALAQHLERRTQQWHRGFLAGREDIAGDTGDADGLRRRAVRKGRVGHPGEHILAGLAATVLDIRREALVQVLQRAVLQLVPTRAADTSLSGGRCRRRDRRHDFPRPRQRRTDRTRALACQPDPVNDGSGAAHHRIACVRKR